MTLATMLDRDVKVLAMTVAVSGGARKKVWTTVKYASLPAAIQPKNARNAVLFKESGRQITHVVYVGDETGGYGDVADLVINQSDMIVYTPIDSTGAPLPPRNFEVVGVLNQDEANRYLRAGCVERHG
jgi:hypothetical protein